MPLTRISPNAAPHRIRWTQQDCAFLASGGMLPERYELIEGDLIDKMGQTIRHRLAVSRLTAWCYSVYGQDQVQSQASVDVSPEDNPTSEPEPDVAALRIALNTLIDNPTPEQIHLVIDASDTTLRFDSGVKADLYARAGIVEYWVLDIESRQLIVHRDPTVGRYASVQSFAPTDHVAPLSAPGSPALVEALLP